MPLSDELLEPISGDEPSGTFLRYETSDTTYAEIKESRTEEEDLPQGEWERERKTADWQRVEELATEALSERTKDLQIAAWLTEALVHREGFGGLRDGLRLMRGLLERFWDSVHPRIEDGDMEFRASALTWVGDRLGSAVRAVPLTADGHSFVDYRVSRDVGYEEDAEDDTEKREARERAIAEGRPTAEDFDAAFEATPKAWYRDLVSDLEAALEALDELEELGDEKFGDSAPSYRRLREDLGEVERIVGRLMDQKLEMDPDPVEPGVAEESSPSGGTTSGDASGGGAGSDGAGGESAASGQGAVRADPRNREEAADLVARAARFLRRRDPANPGPYLMLRGLRWGELRTGGDGVDPKLLAAPPTDVRTRLKGHLLDEEWEKLLDGAEEVMASPYGRGWLDLQRYVLTACDGLGGEYDAVAGSIWVALRSLLLELPELEELTLMDDSPTANTETRAWLRDEGIVTGEDEDDETSEARPPARRKRSPARSAFDRASDRLRSGEPDEAIEILMKEIDRADSARDRFLGQTEVTRIMVETERESVAKPILQQMVEKIEAHRLEEWEDGETVALPLALLYRCLERLDDDPAYREELYERVCRLDPVQALRFSSTDDVAVAADDTPPPDAGAEAEEPAADDGA